MVSKGRCRARDGRKKYWKVRFCANYCPLEHQRKGLRWEPKHKRTIWMLKVSFLIFNGKDSKKLMQFSCKHLWQFRVHIAAAPILGPTSALPPVSILSLKYRSFRSSNSPSLSKHYPPHEGIRPSQHQHLTRYAKENIPLCKKDEKQQHDTKTDHQLSELSWLIKIKPW